MRYRLRTLLTQFSIRDLIWLTFVVASLTAWWHTKRENAALRDDNLAKSQALKAKSQTLEAASKKEARLRSEVEVLTQATRGLGAGLAKKDAELRDSLQRREEVLEAFRILKNAPVPSN